MHMSYALCYDMSLSSYPYDISILIPVPHNLDYYSFCTIVLKFRSVNLQNVLFSLETILAILGFLNFHMNFSISHIPFCKEASFL